MVVAALDIRLGKLQYIRQTRLPANAKPIETRKKLKHRLPP